MENLEAVSISSWRLNDMRRTKYNLFYSFRNFERTSMLSKMPVCRFSDFLRKYTRFLILKIEPLTHMFTISPYGFLMFSGDREMVVREQMG